MGACKHKPECKCKLNFENPEDMCWYENEITCWLTHKKEFKFKHKFLRQKVK